MGMILKNEETRSEVQSKVAAELQERLSQTQPIDHKEVDPAFLEDQHHTSSPGIFIVILLLLLLVAIIWFATRL